MWKRQNDRNSITTPTLKVLETNFGFFLVVWFVEVLSSYHPPDIGAIKVIVNWDRRLIAQLIKLLSSSTIYQPKKFSWKTRNTNYTFYHLTW